MFIYALMKYVELAPDRYARAMNVLTLGNYKVSQEVLLSMVSAGERILDIGCGPGGLALMCAAKGADVTCVDSSKSMLSIFRRDLDLARREGLKGRVRIIECGAASVDRMLDDERFDGVVISFVLGELAHGIRLKTLELAKGLLRNGGRIYVCDELWPENRLLSALYHVLFLLFLIPNFLVTRTLVRPLKNFQADISQCGLRVVDRQDLFMGVMSVFTVVPERE